MAKNGDAATFAEPSISVAICTRNRPASLETCLRSLRGLQYSKYEIVVVNNGSDDDLLRGLAEKYAARYVHVPQPGLSRARNAAAASSISEIIAYLDDDSISDPEWLQHLSEEFQDPEVMAVTGRVDPISGTTEVEQLWAELSLPELERARRASVDNRTPQWFEQTNFGGTGIGCNMAIRRAAWEKWPGFDERLGRGTIINSGEENFAFFGLVSRGYRVVYNPRAIVAHAAPSTMGDIRRRHLIDLSAATAYMTLLFAEFPQHRRRLMRFVLDHFRKSPRDWRERRNPSYKSCRAGESFSPFSLDRSSTSRPGFSITVDRRKLLVHSDYRNPS